MTELTDEQLVQTFEDCTIKPEQFPHCNHVRLGYLFLTQDDFGTAVSRMTTGLKTLVTHLGIEGKYHETITVAFMVLINERMGPGEAAGGWEAFSEANKDLLSMDILYQYYPKEIIQSDTARRVFVMSGAQAA